MKSNIKKIALNVFSIILMIGLVPIIKNDYYLILTYIILISIFLKIYYEKKEYKLLIAGIIFIFLAEFFFILTRVETFTSQTLINMPIWLPVLWGYGFIVIKRISYELLK